MLFWQKDGKSFFFSTVKPALPADAIEELIVNWLYTEIILQHEIQEKAK